MTMLEAKAKFATSKDDLPVGHPLAAVIDADFAHMDAHRNGKKALLIGGGASLTMWAGIIYLMMHLI